MAMPPQMMPYNGPAPAPRRSLNLRQTNPPGTYTVNPDVDIRPASDSELAEVTSDPPAQFAPFGYGEEEQPPQVVPEPQSAPAPPPPDDIKARLEELARKNEELQFQLALAQTPQVPTLDPASLIPPGADPNQTITLQDMAVWSKRLIEMNAALAERAAAGITPDDEAQAVARFPFLANFAEPVRTQKIKEAVAFLKRNHAPTDDVPAATKRAPEVRPAPPVLAAPEAGGRQTAGSVQEPNQVDAAAEYYKALTEIRKEKSRSKKNAMLKEAANRYAQAVGGKNYAHLYLGKNFQQS